MYRQSASLTVREEFFTAEDAPCGTGYASVFRLEVLRQEVSVNVAILVGSALAPLELLGDSELDA